MRSRRTPVIRSPARTSICPAAGLSADSYFNPVGNQAAGPLPAGVAPQDIQYVRRGWEVPRKVQNSLTTYRFSGAF